MKADLGGMWIEGFDAPTDQRSRRGKIVARRQERLRGQLRRTRRRGHGSQLQGSQGPPAPSVAFRDLHDGCPGRRDAFYERTLGLRLSDSSGPVAFMHGAHGSDHHMLALITSDHRGMHHACWDVASIQEVGLGWAQMARAGFEQGWGLGRHVLGANYFRYVRDPWGSYSEYSADIDYIPADCDWKAGHHAPEDSMFLWGPMPTEDFIGNFEPKDVR